MDRNSEAYFNNMPLMNEGVQRSKFYRNSDLKTSFNAADLIPIYLDEVLPADSWKMDMGMAMRMTTELFPVMDNSIVDVYYFYVPSRILMDHWRELNGENRQTYWEQTTEYQVPQVTSPEGGYTKGTIADYFGIPTLTENISFSALPFRAYGMIWNEYFRDQNLKDPCLVLTDDTDITGSNGDDYINDVVKGGMPAKVAKTHDYFTSCLPNAQKGPAVALPLGTKAPVHTSTERISETLLDTAGIYFRDSNGDVLSGKTAVVLNGGKTSLGATSTTAGLEIHPINLFTDLQNATASTVNELRMAFQIQKLYERDAAGGSRYREILMAHFGTVSPDGRQQIPEYLGGVRVPININQVIQTSSTDSTSPQGNVSGWSLTNYSGTMFEKSFTEHGWIIGLAAVRVEQHTYQQGLERMWSRKSRFDFYWPELAHIGNQAVLNKEIYATGTSTDDEAFGYQEAWADYRYKPNRVSGAFRSNYATTLDSWHYADYYSSLPTLSSSWIDEDKSNFDRTLAVQSSVEDQFLANFYFKAEVTREMPLNSVPGLIDHY